jgi:hypothetical protein
MPLLSTTMVLDVARNSKMATLLLEYFLGKNWPSLMMPGLAGHLGGILTKIGNLTNKTRQSITLKE